LYVLGVFLDLVTQIDHDRKRGRRRFLTGMVAAGGSVAGAFLFGQREGIRQAKTVTASTTVMASTTGVQNATVNLVGPASYIIYIDGSTIKAQNGLTGQIDYSNTDAATVIQNAIGQGNR